MRRELRRWTRRFHPVDHLPAIARDIAADHPGDPGRHAGTVVEVFHPGSVIADRVDHAAVTAMVDRGLPALFGAPSAIDAWRSLFAPGDVVGIKVNPVARPLAISSFALVRAAVAGLRNAGVRPRDIVVFDRFRGQLRAAGYLHHLPSGVRWDGPSEDWDPAQLDLEGYDRDVYCELPITIPGVHDPHDERAQRSHLCLLLSRHVNKVVNLPVLKDHGVAGVTLALKNMSHGFFNNVSRSHHARSADACDQFIPALCALPAIRSKVVLHILDGTRAVFDGGPVAVAQTIWAHRTLYFATDPVALDVVGRAAIDAKRFEMGLTSVERARTHGHAEAEPAAGPLRQPQHIERAAALGLGVADRLDHRRIAISE
jgi:hypothetical protein